MARSVAPFCKRFAITAGTREMGKRGGHGGEPHAYREDYAFWGRASGLGAGVMPLRKGGRQWCVFSWCVCGVLDSAFAVENVQWAEKGRSVTAS